MLIHRRREQNVAVFGGMPASVPRYPSHAIRGRALPKSRLKPGKQSPSCTLEGKQCTDIQKCKSSGRGRGQGGNSVSPSSQPDLAPSFTSFLQSSCNDLSFTTGCNSPHYKIRVFSWCHGPVCFLIVGRSASGVCVCVGGSSWY